MRSPFTSAKSRPGVKRADLPLPRPRGGGRKCLPHNLATMRVHEDKIMYHTVQREVLAPARLALGKLHEARILAQRSTPAAPDWFPYRLIEPRLQRQFRGGGVTGSPLWIPIHLDRS